MTTKIGTLVATLPGAWCYICIGSVLGLANGVDILRLGEIESLTCNFYLNVAACQISE